MSPAATRTLYLFCSRKKQILDRLVDLPTPLTPTMDMTYGRRWRREVAGGEVTVSMSRRRSMEDVGVSIFVSEASMAVWILALMPSSWC